ncbi:hypothetical protein BD560DRAFT_417799 [Blakeslea trispora]|nr:hypothetical protein BD560DRAFT_417799 [Blakeslea trispora]
MSTQNHKGPSLINKSADSEILSIIESLVSNTSTPVGYRDIFKKVIIFSRELINERDSESAKASDHLRKVVAAYEQYQVLESLYKEEHKKVLDQHDQQALLEIKLIEKEKALQEALKQVTEANNRIEQLIEEHRRTAQRQGFGRKNIEDKLLARDMELDELKRKHQELESTTSQAAMETDRLKKENHQLKQILAYIRNPQQYSHPQQQQS